MCDKKSKNKRVEKKHQDEDKKRSVKRIKKKYSMRVNCYFLRICEFLVGVCHFCPAQFFGFSYHQEQDEDKRDQE